MKLTRTLRLDPSDLNVFPLAAEPGEWAIPGTFAFANVDFEQLDRKQKLAFASGWLGLKSFGRSTVVEVVEIGGDAFEGAVRALGQHLHAHYGAPGLLEALDAARMELADANALAEDHPAGTLLAIEREALEDGVAERIRVVPPKSSDNHARIWTLEPDEDPK